MWLGLRFCFKNIHVWTTKGRLKKKVKLGLLAEVRAGRRLRGCWGPNPVIRYFLIALKWFKCFKTRNKAIKNVNVITPPSLSPKPLIYLYQNWYRIWKYNPYFPGYIIGGPQFSNKMHHVLKGIDLNKSIKKSPNNRAQVWGGGQASDEV